MQWVSRAESGQTVRTAAGSGRKCTAGGGSAPLMAEPRAELEDVVVETSPCRRFRRWGALHSSRVCSDHRGVNFPAQPQARGWWSWSPVEDGAGCRKIARPVIAHALLRLERTPAMDGCAGTWVLA
eukprot:3391588-Prymnesium_polylepis.2